MKVWRNWARSAMAHPFMVATPRGEEEVISVLRRARRLGLSVRPVGSGHSFSSLAATDGVLLGTGGLSGLRSIDPEARVARFGGGTVVADVAAQLARHGLGLENMGDVDRQTIAGAIATGTHGTGIGFPGLASCVVGLRMVLADGSVVDCSATQRSELFQAARVGLGAFGVVTEVALRCVPAFLLTADEHPELFEDLLEDFTVRMSRADHVEFYWFPHTQVALVKVNSRHPAEAAVFDPLPAWRAIFEDEVVNNGVYGASCYTGLMAPIVIPAMNRLATRLVADRHYTDWSPRVFTSRRRVRFREMEFAVPVESMPDVLREIAATIERRHWRISFPIEVRVAAADDAWLSPAYQRTTGYIAVHRFHLESFTEYFRTVQDIAVAAGGRPHWGKLHTRTVTGLRGSYPRFDEACTVRERVDPDGLFVNRAVARIFGLNAQQR